LLFVENIVLLGEPRYRSKTQYMECKFNKIRGTSSIEMEVEDHTIPQFPLFKHHGSIVISKQ